MDLIMPDKWKEITVKIVCLPYIRGEDVYVDVRIFGNPNEWTYRMKFGKTLWYSIYEHLQKLDSSRFSEELEPSCIDEQLEYLNGRIITIKGIPDSKRTFVKKDGTIESPKIFTVNFRSDLEEAESMGSEILKKAIHDTVHFNYASHECVLANSNLAKFEIEKAKEKEMTIEERQKKNLEQSTEEWVVRKKEEQKNEDKRQKKLGNCAGW